MKSQASLHGPTSHYRHILRLSTVDYRDTQHFAVHTLSYDLRTENDAMTYQYKARLTLFDRIVPVDPEASLRL